MGKDNDQVVRTIPGTDLGGHDTSGVDGKERTERSGEILGTPDPDSSTEKHTADARARTTERTDYVTAEVDRANREELPKLGGNVEDTWEPGDSTGDRSTTAKVAKAVSTATAAPALDRKG